MNDSKHQALRFNTNSEAYDAYLHMFQTAKRSIRLISQYLAPAMLDDPDIVQEISRFCRSSRNASIKILVANPKIIVKRGHRLLQLSRKLTTCIQIRKLNKDYKDMEDCFMITDDRDVLYQPNFEEYKGIMTLDDLPDAKRKTELFTNIWERSEHDVELLQLHI